MTDTGERDARERRGVFGEAADAYEASRPGYPEELVDGVLEYAGLAGVLEGARGDGAPVVEVGAGTGKASLGFARRGLRLTCVEPDARMAEVLRRKLADCPGAAVAVSSFEAWEGGGGREYGLLYAAQSWHWVDAETRWTLAYEALRPGGAMALFWHLYVGTDPELYAEVQAVHERHGVGEIGEQTLLGPDAALGESEAEWPMSEILADGRFVDAEVRMYPALHEYSTARFVDLLTSISAYRMLPEEQLSVLLRDVAAAIDAHGGRFELETRTYTYLARTRV